MARQSVITTAAASAERVRTLACIGLSRPTIRTSRCAPKAAMSSQRPVVSKPIIQYDVMPVIVARRRCEIVERTGVLRSCAEAKSCVAERQRSGVTEAFSRSGRCRGRAIVRLLRAVLVALLNVVRVDSPSTFGAVLEFRGHHRRCRRRRRPGVGWALATVTPPDRTGGERRAHGGHDLVLPIHLVDPLPCTSAVLAVVSTLSRRAL